MMLESAFMLGILNVLWVPYNVLWHECISMSAIIVVWNKNQFNISHIPQVVYLGFSDVSLVSDCVFRFHSVTLSDNALPNFIALIFWCHFGTWQKPKMQYFIKLNKPLLLTVYLAHNRIACFWYIDNNFQIMHLEGPTMQKRSALPGFKAPKDNRISSPDKARVVYFRWICVSFVSVTGSPRQ